MTMENTLENRIFKRERGSVLCTQQCLLQSVFTPYHCFPPPVYSFDHKILCPCVPRRGSVVHDPISLWFRTSGVCEKTGSGGIKRSLDYYIHIFLSLSLFFSFFLIQTFFRTMRIPLLLLLVGAGYAFIDLTLPDIPSKSSKLPAEWVPENLDEIDGQRISDTEVDCPRHRCHHHFPPPPFLK